MGGRLEPRSSHWIVLAALTLAGLSLPAGGASEASSCTPNTTQAWVAQSDTSGTVYYVFGQEIWRESNGAAGLQRVQTFCSGRPSIPPDTCITHSENGALVNCAADALR